MGYKPTPTITNQDETDMGRRGTGTNQGKSDKSDMYQGSARVSGQIGHFPQGGAYRVNKDGEGIWVHYPAH